MELGGADGGAATPRPAGSSRAMRLLTAALALARGQAATGIVPYGQQVQETCWAHTSAVFPAFAVAAVMVLIMVLLLIVVLQWRLMAAWAREGRAVAALSHMELRARWLLGAKGHRARRLTAGTLHSRASSRYPSTCRDEIVLIDMQRADPAQA